jgi:hypothetical protein
VVLRGQHPDGLHGRDFLDPLLGHTLHRALKTLDIGNANHPRLHGIPGSRFWVDDSSPTADRQLTFDLLMVNVISQTRSEYGGQDKDVVSIVWK